MELGSWSHLASRFFDVARSRVLTEVERREVGAWLVGPAEVTIYWEQSAADQRHGLESARIIAAARPDRPDLVRAGLLHDVGKRHSNLGVIRRSLASACAKLRLPVRGSWADYLNHGALAADELARLGAERLVVEFARFHHQARPTSIPGDEWDLLKAADR